MRVEKSTEARNKQRLTPRRVLKAAWIFIPLILAAAMYFLLPMFPEFTEYAVSRGLFKAFTVPVGFVTSLIPLSLTEICAVLADRKSTRLNSSHYQQSRMPSSA